MRKELGWILESGIFSAKKSGSMRLDSNVETRRVAQTAQTRKMKKPPAIPLGRRRSEILFR